MNTFFGIDTKRIIGNHSLVEKLAHNISQNPWNLAFNNVGHIFYFIDYQWTNLIYLLFGIANLALFFFRSVGVHPGKTDVRFWHLNRENTFVISGVNLSLLLELTGSGAVSYTKEELQSIIEMSRSMTKLMELDNVVIDTESFF